MALEFTDANFQGEVLENEGVTLIDFWAPWCGPCKAIAPIVDELSKEYEGKVKIGKVNVDDNIQVSTKFGIRSIPTILIMKGGEVVDKQVGFTTKQGLVAKLENHLS